MVKKQESLVREVKYDQNLKRLVYVRPERATKVLPYLGTRISGVEEFSEVSSTENYSALEKKICAEIVKKGRVLEADAYEIVVKQDNEAELYDDEEDDELNYRLFSAAIFYRKN